MHLRTTNPRQRFAAWLCLFAAICLYAPLAVAAWPAHTSCCDGNHCAIPLHSHRSVAGESHDSHCAHNAAGMSGCSMACCQQQDRAPIAPVAYVMPAAVDVMAPVASAANFVAFRPGEFPRTIEPSSPPPRSY